MTTMANLRTPEAAKRLGITVGEVIELMDSGELPRHVDDHNHLVVTDAEVDAYAARRAAS